MRIHDLMVSLLLMMATGALFACSGDKSDDDDDDDGSSTTPYDARLLSDVYAWECVDPASTGTTATGTQDEDEYYLGVFSQVVTLEHAPNALAAISLPSPGGCTAELDLFPESAGSGGADLDGVDAPEWTTEVDRGVLKEESTGFWRDNVLDNVHSCGPVEDTLAGGTELVEAGSLTGVTAPEPAEVPFVTFDGMTYHESTDTYSFEWGDAVTASWDSHSWEEVWVQIRREREGEAWESVVCNVTGDSSFTLDEAIWDLMDETLEVERNNIYVAFQRSSEVTTSDGLLVKTATRSMAVGVIAD